MEAVGGRKGLGCRRGFWCGTLSEQRSKGWGFSELSGVTKTGVGGGRALGQMLPKHGAFRG